MMASTKIKICEDVTAIPVEHGYVLQTVDGNNIYQVYVDDVQHWIDSIESKEIKAVELQTFIRHAGKKIRNKV